MTLFHDPADRTFAAVPADDHIEVHEINSTGFKRWLKQKFYQEQGRAPSAQAFSDAVGMIDARAAYEGSEEPVYVRAAALGGSVYIDLGDVTRRAVEVDADSGDWRLTSNPPVRFLRPPGLLPLPEPIKGGSLDRLRRFVNVSDDEYTLFIAWIVAALRDVGSFVVLVLLGEQGSAKSTLARISRCLVDPHMAPLRSEPKDARDLMVSARKSWIVCLDNLSVIWGWLSDALCRVSTGGAVATRSSYTNDEEVFLEAMRPVILTGITDFVNRGDLIDRSVFLHLEVIPPEKRKSDGEIWRDFEAEAPAILGALLDALVGGLRLLPDVQIAALPRMAEFALIGEAVSRALGYPSETFLRAYNDNRAWANQSALTDSPLASAVLELVARDKLWMGTAAKLWGALRSVVDPPDELSSSTARANLSLLPKSPNALSGILKRMAPQLRFLGVDVRFTRTSSRRLIVLQAIDPEDGDETSSSSSSSSPEAATSNQPEIYAMTIHGDDSGSDRHGSSSDRHRDGESSPDRHGSSSDRHPIVIPQPFNDPEFAISDDDGDDDDDLSPSLSVGSEKRAKGGRRRVRP